LSLINCSDGKFRSGEYLLGVKQQGSGTKSIIKKVPQVRVEMRLDERKPGEDLWEVSNSGRTLFFDKIQLTKLLTGRMLGHTSKLSELTRRAILGTAEASEDRIISQFEMPPDAEAITTACGLEWGKEKRK